MEIKEAYDKLELTEEEVQALKRYQGYRHTVINTLCNMDPHVIKSLKKDGWNMIENKEEVKEAIEDFVKIYSAMYKISSRNEYHGTLLRGTGNADMSRILDTTAQFLSTTTSEEIAKTFTHYGDAALARITLGKGVPYIEMSDFQNEGSRDEYEVLIAPFCKVSSKRMVSDWNGYKYYQMNLEKPELKELPKEEVEQLKERVVNDFESSLKDMSRYNSVYEKLEWAQMCYQNKNKDPEDRQYYKEVIKETEKEIEDMREKVYSFRKDLRNLLEGLCKEQEKELDEAKDLLYEERRKNEQKRIEKELKEKIEKEKNEANENLEKTIDNSVSKSENLNSNITKIYKNLAAKNNMFEQISKKLNLEYFEGGKISTIGQKVEDVEKIMNAINKEIESEKENIDDFEIDAIKGKTTDVNEYSKGLNGSEKVSNNLEKLSDEFGKATELKIKEGILRNAMSLIKEAKIANYDAQYQYLQNQKIGFFGKLFGKEKLRQEQLKNIELRIKGENIEVIPTAEETNNFSIRNTLAKLYITANYETNGQKHEELMNYFNDIREVFGQGNGKFTDEEIAKIAQQQINQNPNILPVQYGTKESTKVQIARLQADNEYLQTVNAEKEYKSKNNMKIELQSRNKDHTTLIINGLETIEGKLVDNKYYKEEDKKIKIQKSQEHDGKFHDTMDLWVK